MGQVLELLCGQCTAPGATLTDVSWGAGNSGTIRNFAGEAMPSLLALWVQSHANGDLRIISPRMANNNEGIRIGHLLNNLSVLAPPLPRQLFYAQDTLTVQLSGSNVAGDIEGLGMFLHYPDLPGSDASLISFADVINRTRHILTNRVSLTPGVVGGYSGQVSFTSVENMLKANVDYALLGYVVDAPVLSIRVLGSDFGNLGIGGPGDNVNRDVTANWFLNLAKSAALPIVPVFNSANAGAIIVDCMQNNGGAAVNVHFILAELS